MSGALVDVPAVAALAGLAFDPHYREAWNAAQIAAVLAGPGGFLLLAPRPAPLAFALCRQVLDEVELLLCATHPGLRRTGLGRAMLAAVVAATRTRGGSRLFLEVRASNTAARALYAAIGMEQQGLRKSYYRSLSGEGIDAITLGLALH